MFLKANKGPLTKSNCMPNGTKTKVNEYFKKVEDTEWSRQNRDFLQGKGLEVMDFARDIASIPFLGSGSFYVLDFSGQD